jgi:hypothetical protein
VLNGGGVASTSFDGDISLTAIMLGIQQAGSSNPLFGTIRNVRIFGKALPASKLQAMTS